MAQDLNEVQIAFTNEVVRVGIEDLIAIRYKLNALALELANQQSPILDNAEVLNDGDGTSPRTDAPNLTGQNVAQLKTFVDTMVGNIDDTALSALVTLAVRSVSVIIKD